MIFVPLNEEFSKERNAILVKKKYFENLKIRIYIFNAANNIFCFLAISLIEYIRGCEIYSAEKQCTL